MSSISKLAIQGIRSFSPNEKEVIQFDTPLTLIVGQNGTGKTTIIECLKYVTTGDLPPNSKGGAFIHDPRITGDKEIKAQIKLAFNNCNGNQMICTRSLQLLVKKTTQTFKTLEGQLVIFHPNENHQMEKTTISTKVSEMDIQMPFYLGVSKSILDYVIFCHQEDNSWPLSEPSILKKRFDEIFEALKFTKALDSIKIIRKNLIMEIKLLDQSVKYLKNDKEKSNKNKQSLKDLLQKIDDFKQDSTILFEKIESLNKEINILFNSNKEFQSKFLKLENLKFQRTNFENNLNNLMNSIDLLNDSTNEQLADSYSNFENEILKFQQSITDLTLKNEDLKKNLLEVKNSIMDKYRIQVNLQNENEDYLKKLTELDKLMSANLKYLQDSNINSFANLNLNEKFDLFSKDLREFKQETEINLHSKKKKFEIGINEFTETLNNLKDSINNKNNFKNYNSQDLKKLQNENKLLMINFNNNDDTGFQKEYDNESASLKTLKEKLSSFENSKILENINDELNKNDSNLTNLENKLLKINKLINENNLEDKNNLKISILKKQKFEKAKTLESLIDKIVNVKQFQNCFDDNVFKINSALRVYDLTMSKLKQQLKKNLDLKHENNSKLQEMKFLKTMNQEKFEKDRVNMKQLLDKIYLKLPKDASIDQYETLMKEVEEDYNSCLNDKKLSNSSKEIKVEALKIANDKHLCILCKRNFTVEELETFMNNLRLELESNNNMKEIDEEIKSFEKELNDLRSISNDIENYRSLAKEIEKQQKNESTDQDDKIKRIENDNLKVVQNLEKLDMQIKNCESFLQPLNEAISIDADIKDSENSLNELLFNMNKQNEQQDEEFQEDLQDLQERYNNECKSLRSKNREIEQQRSEKLKEFNDLKLFIKDKEMKIKELHIKIEEIERFRSQLEINQLKILRFEANLTSLEDELLELNKEYDSKDKEKTKYQSSNEEIIHKIESELKSMDTLLESIQALMLSISQYDKDKLVNVNNDLNDLKNKELGLENLIESNSEKIISINQDILNQDKIRNNIKNNMEMRKIQGDLDIITEEIKQLQGEISVNAIDKDDYEHKSNELNKKLSNCQSEYSYKLGEIKQIEHQMDCIRKELNEDYAKIDQIYHKEWITLQTKNLVNDDLLKYSKALDSGIMKYHSIKMQEINKVIDELWHSTYKGTDIDTIEIRSDINLLSKNKTYNYRVVMRKQNVELDMRGKCSAGQKVLACIIIRLALAEVFGVNCGMIALDEPTTNLDLENSESLAKSLNKIIEIRKHQRNFQLIVITHDENFLNHMNASDYTDHFYRVSRNDRQKSEIEMVDISRISN